ncbi:MAG: hypothetical protein JNM17_05340 [Archangium sp.]|nr:hypothetical protein [Archangium sp.]
MSLNAYFSKVVGQKQGQFKGGTIERKPNVAPKPTEPAKRKKPADSFEPAVRAPRDPASGQATGKRTHKPFAVAAPRDAVTGFNTGKRNY